jgi:hypothetical protein
MNGESKLCDMTVTGFYKPGYGFEFAQGMKTTTKSPYVERVSVITRGSVTSTIDPFGFDQADAGNGAKLDASRVDATSLEPAMLWNEATFIVPNATGLYMTNGARSELINAFFYFADKAVNAVSGNLGLGSTGTVKLKVAGTSGTFTAGDRLVYKSSTGTVITSGTITTVNGSYIYLNGPVWGFETSNDRSPKTITAYGTAALSTAQKRFGTASLYLDGSAGAYALVPTSTDFLFATGNWTIEFYLYRVGSATTQVIVDLRTTTNADVAPVIYLSSNVLYYYTAGGQHITGPTINANSWYHVAVSKSGTSTKLFINGSQVGSTYTDNNNYVQGAVHIGIGYNTTLPFNGYIDDLRITNVAKYTTTFTTATSALVNDASTVLMLHFDGTNGSTTISDDYLGTQDISSVGASPATATRFTLADYHQFGAEVRSIGSAAVFGNSGVTANGTGTDLKLIAFNVSHIGSGKDLSDDITLTVQANEMIQLNDGKIYYQTVDQSGDFRVGSSFLVNQRTGAVSFGSAQVNLSSLNQLIISDGVNNASIFPTSISVGDIVLSGNTISSQGGNLTIDAAGTLVTINNDSQINGGLKVSGITTVTNATSSVSTATGALIVAGGVGVGENIYAGGTIYAKGWAVSTGSVAGGQVGYIPIQSAPNVTSFISTGSVGYILQMQANNTATWVSTSSLGISAGSGASATISDDVTTNATYYPTFITATSGGMSTISISSSKLTWNPSTGIMSVVDINTTSDLRLKTNVSAIDDALSILDQIEGKSFNYIDSGVDSFGVIAQQIESVLPQLVSNDEEGFKTVRYLPLIAILIEGVKQLGAEIRSLKQNNK